MSYKIHEKDGKFTVTVPPSFATKLIGKKLIWALPDSRGAITLEPIASQIASMKGTS